MIKITFIPTMTPAWRRWRKACDTRQREHTALRSAGQPSKVTDLYKSPTSKAVYLSPEGPFHGKCTYCETKLQPGQHGDIDHYRPKDAVTDEDDQTVYIVDELGNRTPHPGYYWLAYEWTNLLPSCQKCNQTSRDSESGRLIGKGTRFPVAGAPAKRPGEESEEEPLLLKPTVDDPAEHLGMTDEGIVYGRSRRGETTIDMLGLYRRELSEERLAVYRSVREKVGLLKLAQSLYGRTAQPSLDQQRAIERILSGACAYTMAAIRAVEDARRESRD